MNLNPPSFYIWTRKLFSLFSTSIGSMLNPLIYSLRNKLVKLSIKKLKKRTPGFFKISFLLLLLLLFNEKSKFQWHLFLDIREF
jgi:hypothetical protein